MLGEGKSVHGLRGSRRARERPLYNFLSARRPKGDLSRIIFSALICVICGPY